MANETNVAPTAGLSAAGTLKTGVAVIGFFLSFAAGIAVMWVLGPRHVAGVAVRESSRSGAESPVPVSSKDPSWGKRDAPVTVVVYSDFQCPFCSRVEPALKQVRDAYGPEKVRMVWKNNPLSFHPNARPAAEAAQGVFALAGSDAFWKFHDAVFNNQSALGDESYGKWAQEAGVKDMAAFKAGLASHKWAEKVDKDLSDGKAAGVQGTPSFYVNGVFINGAQPFDRFKKTIDDELAKAQAKVAAGTSRSRVYVEMSRENKKNAPPSKEQDAPKEDTTTVFRIPVGSSAALGSPNALVTIVEFSDFQCPYCSRVEPTLRSLQEKYGEDLRVVWKNEPLPFHDRAEPAAEVALEVRAEKGDEGFWKIHDKLFASQGDLSDDALVRLGIEVGASADKLKAAMRDHTHKGAIDADADLADDFQANGTPHFFVDGRRLVGAQPQPKFEAIIDEEIKKARDLVASGIKRGEVYDALTRDGKAAPEPDKKDVPKSMPANDPARGKAGARVIIHEWSDFQCPFCARVEPTLREVMKEYGDRVRLVWHDYPLPMHADAPLASEAGREAFAQKGAAAFWSMHDKMFDNQQKIRRDDLDGYARELGLDLETWKKALDTGGHGAQIEADKIAANEDGIGGTPAFLIVPARASRGFFINGAQSYARFRKLIERALAEGAK